MSDTTVSADSDTSFYQPMALYFRFLDGAEWESTIQSYNWMDSESKKPIISKEEGFGTAATIFDEFSEYDKRGIYPTLHSCLNTTNLKGKKNSDIQGVRVFCVDIDDVREKEEIRELAEKFSVQMLIESSPGKYHLYWRASPIIDIKTWSTIQAGLAKLMGGDGNLSSPSKTIRVPGFRRICKDGSEFVPRIVAVMEDAEELDVTACKALFGSDILTMGRECRKERIKENDEVPGKLRELLRSQDFEGFAKLISSGKRNESLFKYTKQFVIEGGLNGDGPHRTMEDATSFALLLNEHFESPLEEDEVAKTLKSAFEHAARSLESKEAKLRSAEEESGLSADVFPYDYEGDVYLKRNRFTDRGVVARVLQRFGNYIARTGELIYAFDESDKVWRRQKGDGELLNDFVDICCMDTLNDPRFIEDVCMTEKGEFSLSRKLAAEAKFLSNRILNQAVSEVRRKKGVVRKEITEFDSNPNLIYVQNGVLDLETLELREVLATDYMLHRTSIPWDPDSECPYWEEFITQIYSNNESPGQMVEFIQEVFGYTLTGSIGEQKLFVHVGGGSNGKSKLLEVLRALTGSYSALLGCTVLAKSKGALQKEFDRIGPKIEGKRAVIVDDLDTQTQWNEGFVKSLTGPKIPCRYLYAEEKDIPNRAKFHIGCNTLPAPESENYGILRRICLIPYACRFEPDPAKEKEITERTMEELPGILKWAVLGANRMLVENRGIRYPKEVLFALKEYKEDHFKIEALMDEMWSPFSEQDIDRISAEKVDGLPTVGELTDDINQKLKELNGQMIQVKVLGKLLTERGYKSRRLRVKGEGRVQVYYIKRNYQSKSGVDGLA